MIKRVARKVKSILFPGRDYPSIGNGEIAFIDVGSTGGLPSPWNDHSKEIKFLLNFEPNDKPKRRKNILTYNTALWEKEGEFPFYIYKGFNNTGSSLFEQNFEYVNNNWDTLRSRGPENLSKTWHDRSTLVKTDTIFCKTLDTVLNSEFSRERFHFLKIDAQGAEGQILKGAEKFLKEQCVGLHLELFVIPLYKGIMLQEDVIKYLDSLGFKLVKKFPCHGTFDSQNDCLFIHADRNIQIREKIMKIYNLA